MSDMTIRTTAISFAILATALIPLSALAQDPISNALSKCAQIADDGDRLICYDALSALAVPDAGSVATSNPAPEVAPAPASTPEAAPSTGAAVAAGTGVAATTAAVPQAPEGSTPLSDDVGKERVQNAERPEAPIYSATVSRCEESRSSGQYFFVMENGQVWKQANYRRLGWKNCRFGVTITKDGFGYEMYVPEKERTVRVTRIR